ncbi:Chromosome segregation ATPase [Giardia duodenalis]|uniref:Chromosome segregation ATPase n=1 Tax=Giardia intestinalis TaxID=5741 RepID=V6U2C6_GIAIN|nr:Chromosome segregation ATPase [Giardia intestinalis]
MASGSTRAGSPAYMAPETLLEGKATPPPTSGPLV